MANAEIIVSHPLLSRSITMKVDRDLLARASSGFNPGAESAFAIRVKETYNKRYQQNVGYLPWRGLKIEETVKSAEQPTGCALDDCCPGCDQGHHCRRKDRGCHM